MVARPRWLVVAILVLAALGVAALLAPGAVSGGGGPIAAGATAADSPAGLAAPAVLDPAAAGLDPSGPATASTRSASVHTPASTGAQEGVHVEAVEFRLLPAEPEWIEADVTYDLPADPGKLRVAAVDPDVRIVDGDGFVEQPVGWAWNGTARSPTVTVRVRPTTDVSARTWVAYGTDEWAIAEPPPLDVRGAATAATDDGVDLAVDGEGVAGTDLVYLGDHETYETGTRHERIVLVVPAAAELPDPPEDVVALLGHASDRLEVGHRPTEAYHAFVVPDEVRSGLLGRNLGTDSLYFNRFRLDTADGVWVHEYVHARQNNGALTRETRWLSEGSADYYEPLMVLERGHVDFEAFRAELARGREPPFDQVVLSEPGTWQGQAVTYTHGAAVVAAIDREIRAQTGGDATFQGVMAAWARAGTFDQEAFLDAVEAEGVPEARELARELTETTTLPETWDRQTHERLFQGVVPGNRSPDDGGLTVRVTDDPSVAIDGPYRHGVAAGPLAVGESVAVTVEVSNRNGSARTAEPELSIGGRVVDGASITVEPGATETVTLSATLERPGTHDLVVGEFESSLTVHERVEPRIDHAEVVSGDGSRRVEARIVGDDAGIALGEYEIAAGGRTLSEGTVVLAPGDERTVRATLPEDVDGNVTVTVGNASRTVDAVAAGDDGLSGFGPAAALAALLATAGALAARIR